MSAPGTPIPSAEIRRRGCKRLLIAGSLFAVIVLLLIWLGARAQSVHLPLLSLSLPFACAVIGSIEWITGAPYQRVADSWVRLRGWQRGILGTIIVLAALAMILCAATFFVMIFT
jgi:hypothetical protein